MTTLREAAKQALEAYSLHDYYLGKYMESLRTALAEPVQEPVATVTECEACFTPDVCQLRGICDHYAATQLRISAPPQREPEPEPVQEPYCYVYEYDAVFGLHREFYPRPYNGMKPSRTVPVYAHPPQRKPLTDEEINNICAQLGFAQLSPVEVARAIEQQHGIV